MEINKNNLALQSSGDLINVLLSISDKASIMIDSVINVEFSTLFGKSMNLKSSKRHTM